MLRLQNAVISWEYLPWIHYFGEGHPGPDICHSWFYLPLYPQLLVGLTQCCEGMASQILSDLGCAESWHTQSFPASKGKWWSGV